ncbi:unnamed protein product [Symbiodinium sp. CCMP2592]|nr:unnamed protein product [Symbiodinium sp. CCMP2592]
MGFFKYQESPTDGLPAGATTIMIRGVARSMSLDAFIRLLFMITENFDLVYVPVGSKTSTNLGLAFVNYVDEESARIGFSALCKARGPQQFRLVKSAYVQGFCPNLAFILASGNDMEVSAGHHDLVMAMFDNGRRVKDVAARFQESVTPELFAEAQELVARIESEHRKDSSTDTSASWRPEAYGRSQGSSQSSRSSANARNYRNSQSNSRVASYGRSYANYGGMGYAEQCMEPPSPWFQEAFMPHGNRPCAGDGVHQMPMQSMPPMNAAMYPLQPQTQMQQAAARQLQLQQQQLQLQQLQMQQSQLQQNLQDRRAHPQLQREELYQVPQQPPVPSFVQQRPTRQRFLSPEEPERVVFEL